MKLHKICREAFDLSHDDLSKVYEIQRLIMEARTDFSKVGLKLTYDKFIQYVKNSYKPYFHKGTLDQYHKDVIRAVEGDNLDKVEDAAKKKGLV